MRTCHACEVGGTFVVHGSDDDDNDDDDDDNNDNNNNNNNNDQSYCRTLLNDATFDDLE